MTGATGENSKTAEGNLPGMQRPLVVPTEVTAVGGRKLYRCQTMSVGMEIADEYIPDFPSWRRPKRIHQISTSFLPAI